jgi:hypothetical protein
MFPLLGVSVLVTALAAPQPVQLIRCHVSAPVLDPHMGSDIGVTYDGQYALHVRFTNDSDRPLKQVVFSLSDGSTVTETGSFAPGVTIDRRFLLSPNDADSCGVASATFADGTQWTDHAPAGSKPASDLTGFNPDFSHAFTPQQIDAAWNAEVERVMQTPSHTGGG